MAARWLQDELNTFEHNLVDGFPVQQMMELIPGRSEGAIIQKAQAFGFGVITSKEDGITRFYSGLKHRQGEERIAATNDVQVAVAVEVPTLLAEPQRIVSHDALFANNLAVKFLVENNLSTDPKMVYEQSLLILKGLV